MKRRSLFPLMLSLTILATGLLGKLPSTTAAPAPIFRPILRQIQNQLPRNLVFRLPSNIPVTVTRYGRPRPEFQVDPDGSRVVIIWVGCERNYRPGGRGYIVNCIPLTLKSSILSARNSQEFNRFREIGTGFELRRNIQAYYFEEDLGAPGMGFREVQWVQDGILFGVKSANLSRNELTQVARSMANERPMRRSISR